MIESIVTSFVEACLPRLTTDFHVPDRVFLERSRYYLSIPKVIDPWTHIPLIGTSSRSEKSVGRLKRPGELASQLLLGPGCILEQGSTAPE